MTADKIIRIRCDICGKKFGCRRSDIDRKFSFGSYCSDVCLKRLTKAIREAYQ